MKFRFHILLLLAMLCVAAFGQFEMLSSLPNVPEVAMNYSPGSWVEYMIKNKEGQNQMFKFSILSAEKEGEKEYFWFELKSTDVEGKWTIFKFKSTDPKDQQSAVSLIIQTMNEPPKQMDFMLPANRPLAPGTEVNAPDEEEVVAVPEVKVEVVKDVTIETPAGKFKCDKYTMIDETGKTEIWVTPEVPIAGVARAIRDGEGQTELVKYGKNAKSEISGDAQKIELPNLKELLKRPKN